MTLTIGTGLGAYEVVAPLGAGGMGEVYRARDTRLDRDVAIKVLPEAFAADPDRAARFEREARVLASLNHPAIAAIYGIERAGALSFLVLEFVPGETLAERIARGPIPVEEALRLARQIADALEAAHEKGIIHRDLKPANVKVTDDGRVKVLDFGLAKALDPAEAPGPAEAGPHKNLTQSPTITTPAMTRAGMILGTAAYMSPEQARAKAVDKRADIWAFGCVLYEMLTGRRLFVSDEVTDTLALVLTRDPDWQALPPATPEGIRRLVRRCLQKDRAQRLADIADARLEIDEALASSMPIDRAADPTPVVVRPPAWRRVLPWAVATAAVATTVGVILQTSSTPPASVTRVTANLGLDASVFLAVDGGMALSDDGTTIAFVGRPTRDANPLANQLYVRPLDQLRASPLAGSDGASSPFFSPDGRSIAFFAGGRLKKVAVNGGAVVPLCEAVAARGGHWLDDGTIVFQSKANVYDTGPLLRVPDAGGEPQPLFNGQSESAPRWPQMLPGKRAILSTVSLSQRAMEDIAVHTLPASERKIIQRGYSARYLPSGHLVYVNDSTLFAAPFDLDRLELTGAPVRVVEGIESDSREGSAWFGVSASGTLVYLRGQTRTGGAAMHWIDRAGKSAILWAAPAEWGSPRFSPDGRRVAFVMNDARQNADVYTYEWERDILTRLTTDAAQEATPIWSPDGQWIAYGSQRHKAAVFNLYTQRADGTGDVIRLTTSAEPQLPDSWHPSGRFIALHEGLPGSGQQSLGMLPLEGDAASGWKPGTRTVFLGGPGVKTQPIFSPDGRWIAYASSESGTMEVYVRPFPGPGRREQISSGGGNEPRWSRTRRELIFRGLEGARSVRVVPYTIEGEAFRASKPAMWTPERILAPPGPVMSASFDLHPDGERIVGALPTEQSAEGEQNAVFVFNFFDELRRLVPLKK